VQKIKSYAKVNLFLKITRRLLGFHKLYSLVVQINLYDEILIKENKLNKNVLISSGKFKINNQNNTIINLINLMKKEFIVLRNKNFTIHIKKNIPNGSGLGGASSNATAIFSFFKRKYKLKISVKKSKHLLSKIGKDCPMFLNKKVKLIKSSGEKFTEFNKKLNLQMLLIFPYINLSTERVFSRLIKISKISKNKDINLRDMKKLIKTCKLYGNDLLHPAVKILPKLKKLINLIKEINNNNFYSMTGSGSAFFIIFNKKKHLLNTQKMIKKQRDSLWTKVVRTI
tara:strand:+ start:923 stop:1774 length:852 start_codon:yes stop_codon:yes gene_type:complete